MPTITVDQAREIMANPAIATPELAAAAREVYLAELANNGTVNPNVVPVNDRPRVGAPPLIAPPAEAAPPPQIPFPEECRNVYGSEECSRRINATEAANAAIRDEARRVDNLLRCEANWRANPGSAYPCAIYGGTAAAPAPTPQQPTRPSAPPATPQPAATVPAPAPGASVPNPQPAPAPGASVPAPDTSSTPPDVAGSSRASGGSSFWSSLFSDTATDEATEPTDWANPKTWPTWAWAVAAAAAMYVLTQRSGRR